MAQGIKVGDTIRYLNASGGGVVKRVDRGLAWVEGSDGFELPTPISECVVVDSQDTFAPAYKSPIQKSLETNSQHRVAPSGGTSASAERKTLSERDNQDLSFLAPLSKGPWFDRLEGDQIRVHLAYLPVSYEHFGQSPYEAYLINESNYHLLFTYSTVTPSGGYKLRSAGVLEPDMRVLVEEFAVDTLNEHGLSQFQFIAYKPERSYRLLAPINKQLHVDVVKLVRRHSFRPNPFFDEDALVLPILDAQDGTHQQSEETPAPMISRSGALSRRSEQRTQEVREGKRKVPGGKASATPPPEQKEMELSHNTKPKARNSSEIADQPMAMKTPREQPIEQVGLEAERILPNATGMTPHEILLYQLKNFRRELDKRLERKGSKVVFVHGAGQGILHQLIINSIEQDYPMVEYRDVTFDNFPMGAIEVTIS